MSRASTKPVHALAAVLLGVAAAWLLAEGLHALSSGSMARTSLAYDAWMAIRGAGPAVAADPQDPASRIIVREADLKALLPLMKENGVGLGNSPYSTLKTEEASINEEAAACLQQKPGLHKKVTYLRTNLFNPLDPVTFFVDADRKLPEPLQAFLDRYAFRIVDHTTNQWGERVTLPDVDAPRIVLVAGDSVANGSGLDDAETLASRLQSRDRSRRYVNLGIARAAAADITCAIDRAGSRYHGRIDELVYVLCENDFDQGGPHSDPDELATWLAEWSRREGGARVTLVVSPLIYNTMPDITRIPGHSHHDWPTFREQRSRMLQAARERGFAAVDFTDLVTAERDRAGSQFAGLALYVDHTHWSAAGVEQVAAALEKARTR